MNNKIYLKIPSTCPVCGGKTEIKQDNDSKVLVCKNDNCKGKLLGKLTHFVSKNAMNVDGLSEATLEKFIELGYVNSFADIYELKSRFYDELIKLDGFGKKSIDKLMNAIETSKNTTLDRFIYGLSIPLIGKSASKTIARYFNYDFVDFYFSWSTDFDFRILDDFGNSMHESIDEYMCKNAGMVNELSCYMNFETPNIVRTNNNKLYGLTFCITGSLNHFSNRDEAKEKIESNGGKVSGSVSTKTNFLVCNEDSNSSKMQKAKSLGIKIINETELIEMLK